MLDETTVSVKVVGDYACFTRPDLKVERMSYPCMTYAAARGVLDSILWKPEFKWWIHRIKILKPIKFVSIKRNEIKTKQNKNPVSIEVERAQRNSIILKDVAYVIEASVYQDAFDSKNPLKKYREMFNRRVGKGQCYRRPFLGTREFSAEFYPATDNDIPINEDVPIGSILFDLFYEKNGSITPLFAHETAIRGGIFACSPALNEQLMQSKHHRPPINDGVKEVLEFYSDNEENDNA